MLRRNWGLSPVLLCLALGAAQAQERSIEIGGRFLLDDVPGAERGRLRRLLEAYRAGKLVD